MLPQAASYSPALPLAHEAKCAPPVARRFALLIAAWEGGGFLLAAAGWHAAPNWQIQAAQSLDPWMAGALLAAAVVAFLWWAARVWRRAPGTSRSAPRSEGIDPVTGIANRHAFMERLCALYASEAAPIWVLSIDLDRFRDVNDTLGHAAGDALLRQAAQRLRAGVAAADMVAHFGGDTFAILHVGSVNRARVRTLAGRIAAALSLPYDIDGSAIAVTASIGIARSLPQAGGPEVAVMQADLARYRAKDDGRNCIRVYDPALDERFRERATIGDELRVGLSRGEFTLHYQPQVEIVSGRVVGLEALIRWHHPQRGMVPPSLFIPFAEKTGAILPLGRWAFNEACRQLAVWQTEGIAPPTLAVGLSALHFRQATLEAELCEIMTRHAVGDGVLEVALTESALIDAGDEQCERLKRMSSRGLKVAVDDFGMGHASLNYLAACRVDRLKIGPELVLRVARDVWHDLMMKAAIQVAQDLGIEPIAKGVETEAQARFLAATGCATAQGHFFSRPLTAEAATALLRRGRINSFAGTGRVDDSRAPTLGSHARRDGDMRHA